MVDAAQKKSRPLEKFFDFPIMLKDVKRTGWISKVKVANPESVADHSYSMCMAGMVLSDLQGLDTLQVVRMILLHDLAESLTGDFAPGDISRSQKISKENSAMAEILSHLPDSLRKEYARIWDDYVEGKSEVSRFVHRIDKLEMAMQARSYSKKGYPAQTLLQFLDSAEKTVLVSKDAVSEILMSLKNEAGSQ